MDEVWDDSALSCSEKLVLLKIADNANGETRQAFPGVAYLAAKTGLSERQVKRVLAGLVERGRLVVVNEGGGRSNKTLYRMPPNGDAGVTDTEPAAARNGDKRRMERVTPATVNGDTLAGARVNGGNPQEPLIEPLPDASHPTVPDSQTAEVRAVFEAWKAATGRNGGTKLTDERRDLIRRKLKHYPADDLIAAVRGWRHFPHNRGENEQGTVYNDLGLLLRDAAHIERFRDAERAEPWAQGAPAGSKKQRAEAQIGGLLTRARELAAMGR
jgi:hypothetical protein